MSRPRLPTSPIAESVGLWALSFAAIVIAFVFFPRMAKPVATVCFLYLPLIPLRQRDEDYRDYGLTLRCWRKDLFWALLLFAVIVPPYIGAFLLFPKVLHWLPRGVGSVLTPFVGEFHFRPRLPPRFHLWVVDQLFVVALPEEFFYRGYLQTRLKQAWPNTRRLMGIEIGPAFWATAALFAVGHLAIFQVWRLAVFFPALLFGWLRERTGTVLGAALLHALCNLLELVLEASFI